MPKEQYRENHVLKRISHVEFKMFTPAEIRKLSTLQVGLHAGKAAVVGEAPLLRRGWDAAACGGLG